MDTVQISPLGIKCSPYSPSLQKVQWVAHVGFIFPLYLSNTYFNHLYLFVINGLSWCQYSLLFVRLSHLQQSSYQQMGQLLLDDRMLVWVFFPIIYVTCLIQLFRFYYTLYTAYTTFKKPVKKQHYQDTKDKAIVQKCQNLAKKYLLLSKQAFDCRRTFLCKAEEGYLIKNGDRPPEDATNNMMAMQSGMMDNMKGMMVMMLTTMPAMAWINSFFAGFVLAKVPFSLTQQFRAMTQSGIDMANLDVSYVSSVSFYFLIVFGLNQLQPLFIDDTDSDEGVQALDQDRKNMAGGMNPMAAMGQSGGLMGAANQGKEKKQIFKAQVDGLELISHKFVFENSKKEALNRLKSYLSE